MSTKESQQTINQTRVTTGNGETSSAVLGVAVGEDRYLISMAEVSEVIPIPKLAHVPLTQPWFLGVANVRGNLYGVTDLGVYLGKDSSPYNQKSRILLASPGDKLHGGFIVNSMLGIRSLSEFTSTRTAKKKLPKGIIKQYKDTEGRLWLELSLFALIREEKFLHIARE